MTTVVAADVDCPAWCDASECSLVRRAGCHHAGQVHALATEFGRHLALQLVCEPGYPVWVGVTSVDVDGDSGPVGGELDYFELTSAEAQRLARQLIELPAFIDTSCAQ